MGVTGECRLPRINRRCHRHRRALHRGGGQLISPDQRSPTQAEANGQSDGPEGFNQIRVQNSGLGLSQQGLLRVGMLIGLTLNVNLINML